MKKLLAMLLLTAMVLSLAPLAVADGYRGADGGDSFGVVNMPDAVKDIIANGKWSHLNGWEITGWVTFERVGVNSAFAAVKNGTQNVLLAFAKESGAWKYKWHNASALPQVADEIQLGYLENQIALQTCYVVDNEIMEAACVWTLQSGGVWRLTHVSVFEPDLMFFDTSKDGVMRLYNTGWVSGRETDTKVYGAYQTDLRYFNWSQFPKTVAQAREKLSNPPKLPEGELTAKKINFTGGKKYPVYAGPGESYERAASGKAVVSTNDWIQVFGEQNGYIMIQYDITSDRLRVGWIERSALPKNASAQTLSFHNISAEITSACALTDDPLKSRSVVRALPAGARVAYLSSLGDYAYVETDDHKLRGFAPMNCVRVTDETRNAADITGDWFIWAGGSMIADYASFRDDGTFSTYQLDFDEEYDANTDFSRVGKTPWQSGTYAVTHYDASMGLFWNNPDCMLTLTTADGQILRYGLNKEIDAYADGTPEKRDSLQISDNEGAGGYLRCR